MIRALSLLCFVASLAFAGKPKPDGVTWHKVGTVIGVCSNYTPVVSLDATHIRVYSNTDCTSWATSPDGIVWTWAGPIGIFGRNQSSAAALLVDEARTDDYRFMAWLDLAGGLVMMHSADGVAWASDGLNMWPIAGEQPQFVTAAKDQFGYHLIGANSYPATALRHAWSCDGLHWRIIEPASDVINTSVGKGTNLVYESTTNLLHALTSGAHWSITPAPYPC